MKDALCCLFICYLTIRIMIKSGELMEKKGLIKHNEKPNKIPMIMINVLKIINNHLIK